MERISVVSCTYAVEHKQPFRVIQESQQKKLFSNICVTFILPCSFVSALKADSSAECVFQNFSLKEIYVKPKSRVLHRVFAFLLLFFFSFLFYSLYTTSNEQKQPVYSATICFSHLANSVNVVRLPQSCSTKQYYLVQPTERPRLTSSTCKAPTIFCPLSGSLSLNKTRQTEYCSCTTRRRLGQGTQNADI